MNPTIAPQFVGPATTMPRTAPRCAVEHLDPTHDATTATRRTATPAAPAPDPKEFSPWT